MSRLADVLLDGCREALQVAKEENSKLESLLKDAEGASRECKCGKCGRPCLPDGDCYGCECDRLGLDNQRLYEKTCMMGELILTLEQEIVVHKAEIARLSKEE
jgi:hypothetical protein